MRCQDARPIAGCARTASKERRVLVGSPCPVDDHLRASDPRIFAAGDLVEHRFRVAGLWPAAVEQA